MEGRQQVSEGDGRGQEGKLRVKEEGREGRREILCKEESRGNLSDHATHLIR